MIDYSVSARPNPRDREAAPKYYASPQVSENISMSEFCKHIASHGSVYSHYCPKEFVNVVVFILCISLL